MMNPGDGLAHLDTILSTPNRATGKPWSSDVSLDETVRMMFECDAIINNSMENVPEPVRRVVWLLATSVGSLAAEVRRLQKAGG